MLCLFDCDNSTHFVKLYPLFLINVPLKAFQKTQKGIKWFENEGLVRSQGELLEAPNWTMKARKTLACSAAEALVQFFAGAFPCSVALVFWFWGYRSMVQHGLTEGVHNIYKTNAKLHILKMKGTQGAATKTSPKNKMSKKRFKNKCFVRSPWALFGVHLSWSIFWCAKSGCSGGSPKMFKTI